MLERAARAAFDAVVWRGWHHLVVDAMSAIDRRADEIRGTGRSRACRSPSCRLR